MSYDSHDHDETYVVDEDSFASTAEIVVSLDKITVAGVWFF